MQPRPVRSGRCWAATVNRQTGARDVAHLVGPEKWDDLSNLVHGDGPPEEDRPALRSILSVFSGHAQAEAEGGVVRADT